MLPKFITDPREHSMEITAVPRRTPKKQYLWASAPTIKLLAALWEMKERWRHENEYGCSEYISEVEKALDEFGYKPAKARSQPFTRVLSKR